MDRKSDTLTLSRRSFLIASAAMGAGFVVGCAKQMPEGATFGPFVRIGGDNSVTVISKHIEFGQGAQTGLAAIVAEELDADWDQVGIEMAPSDIMVYYNTLFGKGFMGTGGSSAIRNSWTQLRMAGAAARSLLVQAAADRWGVSAADIKVAKGIVSHGSKSATFGELAADAGKLTPPENPELKDPASFTIIGTNVPKRLDGHDKIIGKTAFTIDQKRDGMRTALIAKSPRFGGKVASFDDSAARAVPGVYKVVQVPSGVAVVAKDFWSAHKGRDALEVKWDFSQAENRSSTELFDLYRNRAATPGKFNVDVRGDAAAGLQSAAQVIEKTFEFPFLAHATMEPMNAVAQIRDGKVDVWTGSQIQTIDLQHAAGIAGVDVANASIHTLPAGGSFGRRANLQSDFVSDAVSVAKALNDGQPVMVQWTREDDMRGGKYRPMAVHKVSAGLDADGNIIAWRHVIVAQPLGMQKPGTLDDSIVEGVHGSPYLKAVADLDLTAHQVTDVGVPVLWWRSVGNTHTAFVMEHMIDQCANAAGQDPVAYRRKLLKDAPRHLTALNLAVEKSGYGAAQIKEHALGVAVHESFGSVVAEVAEVSMDNGQPKTHKVTVAFDCGIAVTPDLVRAQAESAVGYGLGAILRNEVTLQNGEVEQDNFDTYLPLRIDDMPVVDTHIVPSGNAPTGVGEPGTPPIGPAVANAVLALTGNTITKLPFSRNST